MLQRFKPRHVASATALFVMLSAGAQTAPPTIPTPGELGDRRPEVATDPSRLPAVKPPPRQLGKPEDETKLDIVRFEVAADAPAALRANLARLTQPFVGPGKTFADMADAAAEASRFLQRDLGYYLGFAYIPEQSPKDGVVRIEVLEGRLDAVELQWKDGLPVDRSVVEGYLSQLKPGAVLLVRDVERVVFLVNDLRGLAAEFEVRAGRAPGTAMLVVKPRAVDRTTWSLELDNTNARTLGQERLSASVTRYSPFGRGDSVTGSLIASKGLTFALGNYTSPVGASGLRLGASLSALQYKVDRNSFPLGIEGEAATVSVFGLYPFVRSRNLNLFVVGTLDAKSYRDTNGGITNPKQVSNASIGLTGDVRDSLLGGGINSLDAQITSGRITFDRPVAFDAPDTSFSKITFRAVRLQNLIPGLLQGYGAVRLQKAFNNLDVTEQFRAGGPDGVRAFPAGEGSGDNGALVTVELRVVPPVDWFRTIGGRAFVSVFYDWSRIEQRNELRGQDASFVNLQSYAGWGVATVWNGPNGWNLRASVAAPTENEAKSEADRSKARFFVTLSKQF